MNAMIHRDFDRLTAKAERIEQDPQRLEKDRSTWVRKPEEKDLADLVEDLKGAEGDLGLMLTDCICASSQCGQETPKVVFHDLHEIFACLDTLFNGLKKARLRLDKTYIHCAILDHLEIDYGRFAKLIVKVRRHLNAQQRRTGAPLAEGRVHLAQEHAAPV